jgi:membrane associated rhomboid family serine protease
VSYPFNGTEEFDPLFGHFTNILLMSAYNRPGRFSFFPPVIKALLVSNAIVFALSYVFGMMRIGGDPLQYYFYRYAALFPVESGFFLPWQVFTYMFMHGDFSHILFNMLALWMFGLELEHLWGSKKFFIYYTLCGLGGGIAHLIISPLMGGGNAPLVGASGAIFGLLIAFGLLFPDRPIYLYFFIPMRAKFFVALYMALEFFLLSSGSQDGVSHLAHLGGAVVGIIYMVASVGGATILANFRKPRAPKSQWNEPRQRSPFGRRVGADEPIEAEYQEVGSRSAKQQTGVRVITQSDIDAILDKIAAKGYGSLSDEEREILFEASRKMDERK